MKRCISENELKNGSFLPWWIRTIECKRKKRVTCDVIDWMKDWTFKFDCSINMCSPLLVTKAKLDRERHEHLQTTRTHLKRFRWEKDLWMTPHAARVGVETTLKEAYSSGYQRVQVTFKDLMIHWILQFALTIAFCCVLHRSRSQDIRC
jgi:hypothetical protein